MKKDTTKLREAFDLLFESSKYSALNFDEWLDTLSPEELDDVVPDLLERAFAYHRGMAEAAIELLTDATESLTVETALTEVKSTLQLAINAIRQLEEALPQAGRLEMKLQKRRASAKGRQGAEARHNRMGGSRQKADMIRAMWATGKYSSRSLCAEEECRSLGMSFDAARRALKNTPEPPARAATP